MDIDLGAYDILCVRGKFSLAHVGNRRFRVLIAMHIDKYLALKNRAGKSAYVIKIVEQIRARGGRFLRKNLRSDYWEDIGDKLARKKVGHALRDAHNDRLRNLCRRQKERNSPEIEQQNPKQQRRCQPRRLRSHHVIEEFTHLFDDLICKYDRPNASASSLPEEESANIITVKGCREPPIATHPYAWLAIE